MVTRIGVNKLILRKPYAFLIKKFKIIHLILTVIYIYLAIKVNGLLSYYNHFLEGTESKLNAINYITNYYLIAIIASIIICLIVFALMKYKKKPKLLYLILIVLYLVVAVIINISYKGLNTIYISTLDIKSQRVYRDFLKIIIIFQYISIAFTLVRGLGFDIKKFNFKEDISELELDITDNEEVELTIGSTEGLERNLRRRIRELNYYYKENKLFINIVIIIIIVLLVSSMTINKQVINKVYQENETFSTDAFTFKVTNTYLTNKTYNNKTINSDNKSTIIIRMTIQPHSTENKLNSANLVLKIGNNNYTINNKQNDNFKDLGYNYNNTTIKNLKTYIFNFTISNDDKNKKMQLVYAGNKKINLNPINLDEINNTKKYKLKDKIDFTNTSLGSGELTINSYEIKNKFPYEYTYEINGKTYKSNINIISSFNTIINLKLSGSFPFKLTTYDFLATYGKLKYKINNEEYTSKYLKLPVATAKDCI
jgi:hypothetical protein